MLAQLQKRPIESTAAAIVVALAIINGVPPAIDQNLPWFADRLGGMSELILPILTTLSIGGTVYFGLQYSRYRAVLRTVTRDYFAEKFGLENQLDPEHHGPVSARVGYGKADPHFGNEVLARYGLPPEKEFG